MGGGGFGSGLVADGYLGSRNFSGGRVGSEAAHEGSQPVRSGGRSHGPGLRWLMKRASGDAPILVCGSRDTAVMACGRTSHPHLWGGVSCV